MKIPEGHEGLIHYAFCYPSPPTAVNRIHWFKIWPYDHWILVVAIWPWIRQDVRRGSGLRFKGPEARLHAVSLYTDRAWRYMGTGKNGSGLQPDQDGPGSNLGGADYYYP